MGPVRELLRRATDDRHRALEADVDALRRFSAEPERSRLAAGYRSFTAETEAALSHHAASLAAAGLPLPGCGERSGVLTIPPDAPASTGEALGYLYVVCGSALGGTMILRSLAERGCDTGDLAFLVDGPYAAPALWRSLLLVLERDLPSGADRNAALAGALKAFAAARNHLCPAA